MMHTQLDPRRRSAVVLLVVISMLTLFSVLGLSFVLYANATAEGARLARQAESESQPDVDSELLFSLFLGQLLYDAPDDATGVYSGLRGHSLARSLFGMNYTPGDTPAVIAQKNSTPYNGTGRLHVPIQLPGINDDYPLINYTYFPQDGFLRDPERPGTRIPVGSDPLGFRQARFLGGFNAPYTYPDLNNMFLAAMRADGSVLLPSFHRPWTGFGDLWTPDLSRPNPNWYATGPQAAALKYLTLRPRPADHDPTRFPAPEDPGGDVKNLIGYPGTLLPNGQYADNDSIWIDLDAPVFRAPDGRKFKPLFAPLIIDLDNRVNLNVHGNARGVAPPGRAHLSNQGWGPWEVNPGHLGGPIDPSTPLTAKQQEWVNLVTGTLAPDQQGRRNRLLGFGDAPPGVIYGHVYSPIDLDGGNEATGRPSDPTLLPGRLPSLPWQCFPSIPAGYGNGLGNEVRDHPLMANAYTRARNYVFPLSNMEALLRYGDTNSPALTSELFRLAPFNFGDLRDPDAIRRRNLVTVHSADIDRPGVMPYFWSPFPVGSNLHLRFPDGAAAPSATRVPTPPLNTFMLDPVGEYEYKNASAFTGPDFRTADYVTALRRLDLNRYLPPYPPPDNATGTIPNNRIPDYAVAVRARQIFAEDIFERLCRLTGAGKPTVLALAETDRRDAFRWLAQLAANIVDFIDTDDYHTPFPWAPGEWVFGTELPRLVINEVYAQQDNHNHPLSTLPPQRPMYPTPRARRHALSFWVELHNPLAVDPSLPDGGAALLQASTYSVYRLQMCRDELPQLRQRHNVSGNPLTVMTTAGQFGPPGAPLAVLPANGQFADPSSTNRGFYVLGPDLNPEEGRVLLPEVQPPLLPVSFRNPALTYIAPVGWSTKHTVLLRRLAFPHMPPNEPSEPGYNPLLPLNPYLTVDCFEQNRCNDGAIWDYDGNPLFPMPHGERESWGRKQPYAAPQMTAQFPKPDTVLPPPNMPRNSFFQHNVDNATPGPNWPAIPPAGYPAFDWLVHLDRPLVSPMELLHVSAFKPHELTQQFVLDTNQKYKHRAPWLDEHLRPGEENRSLRLSRVLEFFTTHNLHQDMNKPSLIVSPYTPITAAPPDIGGVVQPLAMAGPTMSGGTWSIEEGSAVLLRSTGGEEVVRVSLVRDAQNRPVAFRAPNYLRQHRGQVEVVPLNYSDRIPGKINLNTVWDVETFLALCDPQPANEFNLQEVRDIFEKLMDQRTPGWRTGRITERDRPFLGMAVGQVAGRGDTLYDLLYPRGDAALFPGGIGIEETFFRSKEPNNPSAGRLLHTINGDHAYFQTQLLHKIFNQITPRSNVFAVWLTVGFFEVMDDTTRPVKLGAELGRAEGKHIRHRMFGVVDRSVMIANPGPQPQFRLSSNPANPWTTGLVVPYYSIID